MPFLSGMNVDRLFRDKEQEAYKSCHAPIVWLKTEKGKNMPVDAEFVESRDQVFDPKAMVSHFAICPHSAMHRRRK